jgi:hypothetical protein
VSLVYIGDGPSLLGVDPRTPQCPVRAASLFGGTNVVRLHISSGTAPRLDLKPACFLAISSVVDVFLNW